MTFDNQKDNTFYKEKIAFAKLMIVRNRILSVGIIMLLVSLVYLALFATSYPVKYFLIYAAIGGIYLLFYYFYPKAIWLVLLLTCLFYVGHTYFEISNGLDFSYFEKYRGKGKGNNLGNHILNSLIAAYPYIRYAMVFIFVWGFIPYLKIRKQPELFDKLLKEVKGLE